MEDLVSCTTTAATRPFPEKREPWILDLQRQRGPQLKVLKIEAVKNIFNQLMEIPLIKRSYCKSSHRSNVSWSSGLFLEQTTRSPGASLGGGCRGPCGPSGPLGWG